MRLPLVGPYNTRPSTTAALTTSSGIVGIGVVGIMIVGQTTQSSQKDRRFINCNVEVISDDLQRQAAPYVVKRPGFAVAFTPQAGSVGSAIHVWVGQGAGGSIISAFGGTNSNIYTSASLIGAITGVATGITETTISGTATLTISSTDNTGWYFPDAGALTQITDGDFPGNAGVTLAGTFVHMFGWAFIYGTNGLLYNSDLNSVANWTAGNAFATNSYPDKGVGAIRHRNTIMALGTQSFEVLNNAGTPPPGSPLARIDSLTQKIGAVTANAIINVDDVIYFAGATQQGNVSIYAYDGGKAQPISTDPIDAQILLAGPSNVTLSAGSWYGQTILIVQAASVTYAYAVGSSNPWFEMSSQFPIWQRMDGISVGSTIVNYSLSTTDSSGIVYVLNPASAIYTDNGFAYTAVIQTATRDDQSNNRKFYNSVTVIGDQEESSSSLMVAWTDDDYRTFDTDVRAIDLSKMDRITWRLGTSRKRAWKLLHSANTPMRLQALDIDVLPLQR